MNVARCDSSIDDVEPDDAGERAAGDDDVVERGEGPRRRPPGRAGSRPASAIRSRERRTRPPEAARARDSSSSASAFERNPTLPEVDAQDRHVDLGDRPGPRAGTCRPHRARRGRRSGAARRRCVRGVARRDAHCSTPCMRHQPAARSRSSVACSIVGLYANPMRPMRTRSPARSAPHAAATASSIRSSTSAHDGPAWRWTRNSRLPSGPWIGDAMTARVPSPSSAAAAAISRDDPAVDRRVADDAALRLGPARLELRLHERDDRAAAVAQHRADRAEDEPQRDERDVDDGEVRGLRQDARRERPRVDALHRDDAWVLAQPLGELAVADVERVDPRRAAGEEHVGEPAGRGADVERRRGPPGRSRTRRAPRSACARRG